MQRGARAPTGSTAHTQRRTQNSLPRSGGSRENTGTAVGNGTTFASVVAKTAAALLFAMREPRAPDQKADALLLSSACPRQGARRSAPSRLSQGAHPICPTRFFETAPVPISPGNLGIDSHRAIPVNSPHDTPMATSGKKKSCYDLPSTAPCGELSHTSSTARVRVLLPSRTTGEGSHCRTCQPNEPPTARLSTPKGTKGAHPFTQREETDPPMTFLEVMLTAIRSPEERLSLRRQHWTLRDARDASNTVLNPRCPRAP